jgi:hypothetical protein
LGRDGGGVFFRTNFLAWLGASKARTLRLDSEITAESHRGSASVTAGTIEAANGGGGVGKGDEEGRVKGESGPTSTLPQRRPTDPSLRAEGEINPRLEIRSCPETIFSDEEDCDRRLRARWN